MSIYRQFGNLVRRAFGIPVGEQTPSDFEEDYPDDLAGMASVLSLTIEPRAQFVDSLGVILSSMESPISTPREPARPGVFRWRKVALRVVYAAIALAILGALTVYLGDQW